MKSHSNFWELCISLDSGFIVNKMKIKKYYIKGTWK